MSDDTTSIRSAWQWCFDNAQNLAVFFAAGAAVWGISIGKLLSLHKKLREEVDGRIKAIETKQIEFSASRPALFAEAVEKARLLMNEQAAKTEVSLDRIRQEMRDDTGIVFRKLDELTKLFIAHVDPKATGDD